MAKKVAKKPFVVNHWFDEAIAVNDDDGAFIVRQGNKWGLYDSINDRLLVPVNCDSIDEVECAETGDDIRQVFRFCRGKKSGYYNLTDRVLFISECDDALSLDTERPLIVKVCKDKRWRVANLKTGKVVSPEFDEITALVEFPDQELFVVREGNKIGLYDLDEERIVMPIEFDEFAVVDIYLFKVRKGGSWGLYDTNREAPVIDLVFDEIICVGGSDVYQVRQNGKIGFARLPS